MGFLRFMKSTGYALHGIAFLARHNDGEPIQLREIAGALGMPENYMAKIFQTLSRAGLVNASRGAHRGYRLVRPAEDISLLEVIELYEGPIDSIGCFLDENSCAISDRCLFGGFWGGVKKEVRRRLEGATIQQFLKNWPAGNTEQPGDILIRKGLSP
ncbi:MAG: Rrf2 family transcriptional regulator [Deltaproteobacteria bacterium]|nr:Rrf2 family transcriptional regulator [Deltaproteobacteria bacterium]MBW2306049.1 Rrf2 family transcriptional regulator [Deltaproteobacteria bacterium]